MNKTIRNLAITAAAIAACTIGTKAHSNPLINNYENSRDSFVENIEVRNQPRNGGTTTLAEKCEAMAYFEQRNDWGKIMEVSFQMGFEHDLGSHDVDSACRQIWRAGL